MTPEYAIAAIKEHDARQDTRLDNHGERIRKLELLAKEVELLRESVEGLRGNVRQAIVALILMGVGSLVMERFF